MRRLGTRQRLAPRLDGEAAVARESVFKAGETCGASQIRLNRGRRGLRWRRRESESDTMVRKKTTDKRVPKVSDRRGAGERGGCTGAAGWACPSETGPLRERGKRGRKGKEVGRLLQKGS